MRDGEVSDLGPVHHRENVREDQQRELEEERARDDDDLGEEAPLGPGP